MKNKGFTLIEILAVIVLLGIIALISYPSVKKWIDESKQALYKEQIELIEDSLRNYASNNLLSLPEEDAVITFALGQIKESGNMQIEVKNPKNNKCFSNESLLTITRRNKSYIYDIKDLIDVKCEEIEDAPVIKLNGKPIEHITVGDTYVDKGATAKSSTGTDLTSYITTTISGEGTIDTSVPGIYTVTYSVTNDGKTNSSIRNVIVGEKKYINGIMTSTDNCINEGKCSVGTEVNVQVSSNQKYNFYVIDDNTTALTLIMDSNLGDNVEWISASDYAEANKDDGTVCEYESCTDEGPITAVNELKNRTSGWTNIPEREYTFSDDGAGNMYTTFSVVIRARFLTYAEATDSSIGCTTSSETCPNWMYTNLNGTGSDTDSLGNNKNGYWISAAHDSNVNFARDIDYHGRVENSTIDNNRFGIRPVITLLK